MASKRPGSGKNKARAASKRSKRAGTASATEVVDPDMKALLDGLDEDRRNGATDTQFSNRELAREARRTGKIVSAIEPAKVGVDTAIVNALFGRVKEMKGEHPEMSGRIDTAEAAINDALHDVRLAIDGLPEQDRELVTVLVINRVHRMCDEYLIPPDFDTDADA